MPLARKRFGQHYLHDDHVIARIIAAIAAEPGDCVVEIGPGGGALTLPLLTQLGRLSVVELDRDLIPDLISQAASLGDLTVYSADALRFDFRTLGSAPHTLRIVGNLPYNISTPLLFHLLTQADVIRDMVFMLQKEVVDRMTAMPGSKHYGRLSVMIQYYCQAEALFTVSPEAFTPKPQVDSAVLRLLPHKVLPYPCQNVERLAAIVQHAFNQRRKTLRNSLRAWFTTDSLETLGIDPQLRAEQLSLERFVLLANTSEGLLTQRIKIN